MLTENSWLDHIQDSAFCRNHHDPDGSSSWSNTAPFDLVTKRSDCLRDLTARATGKDCDWCGNSQGTFGLCLNRTHVRNFESLFPPHPQGGQPPLLLCDSRRTMKTSFSHHDHQQQEATESQDDYYATFWEQQEQCSKRQMNSFDCRLSNPACAWYRFEASSGQRQASRAYLWPSLGELAPFGLCISQDFFTFVINPVMTASWLVKPPLRQAWQLLGKDVTVLVGDPKMDASMDHTPSLGDSTCYFKTVAAAFSDLAISSLSEFEKFCRDNSDETVWTNGGSASPWRDEDCVMFYLKQEKDVSLDGDKVDTAPPLLSCVSRNQAILLDFLVHGSTLASSPPPSLDKHDHQVPRGLVWSIAELAVFVVLWKRSQRRRQAKSTMQDTRGFNDALDYKDEKEMEMNTFSPTGYRD